MNPLLPLLQQELARHLPALRGWAQQLLVDDDPAKQAQWSRSVQALGSAASVLAEPSLSALVHWLGDWVKQGEARRSQSAEVAFALAQLQALAEAAPGEAERLVAALSLPESRAQGPAALSEQAQPAEADGSLRALFGVEVEDRTAAMSRLVLQLEQQPDRLELIAPLMRAAHSIKGAARVVGESAAVSLVHAMEDSLANAQRSQLPLDGSRIELLLNGIDLLRAIAQHPDPTLNDKAQQLVLQLQAAVPAAPAAEASTATGSVAASSYIDAADSDPILRIRASLIGRLIALASSEMVESRRLRPFAEQGQRLRALLGSGARQLDELHRRLGAPAMHSVVGAELSQLRGTLTQARQQLGEWLEAFGEYSRDAVDLTERLYDTASKTRLRPFSDIAQSYPRVVRDLARQLGKRARAEIQGEQVAVDRDVLERLDAPLTHLLRNAVDHGIELAAERSARGKSEEGVVRIGAGYRAGMLAIDISDDGGGLDYPRIRERLLGRGLVDANQIEELDEDALQDFLFAPGFSTRDTVSETSGRGVGLDVVRQMLRQLGGSVRIAARSGAGTSFHLLVPISRAVTRALIVETAGELYAFPLVRLERIQRIDDNDIVDRDSAPFFSSDGGNIGLLSLARQLELDDASARRPYADVVVLSLEGRTIGFVVDRIVGELDLAVRPLDIRLGRVADVGGVAVLPDGRPVVMVDVDDLMRSALEQRRRQRGAQFSAAAQQSRKRRVLVVDDSISVRELERQLLAGHGYEVDAAVDGADAWGKLRSTDYDLLVTDIDMPRMDGIELTRSVKQDPRLRQLPVVIVSYRDRPEDRERGLQVHADAYFTKGDFREDGFLAAVRKLIGEPEISA